MINLNYELNAAEHERLTDVVAELASNCDGVACEHCVLHYLKVYNEDGVELTECCDIAEYVQSLIEKTTLKPCKLCGDTPHEYDISELTDGFVLTHYCTKRIRRSESRLERVITVYGDTREEVIDIWNAGPDDDNNIEEE